MDIYLGQPGQINNKKNKKSQSNLGRDASPPLTVKNNYAKKSPLVTMGCPTFTPKLPIPLRRSPPDLIHPPFKWPHSPPQMASRSNQPFSHNSPTRQTDRHTDRQMG